MQTDAIIFIELGQETVPAGKLVMIEDGRWSSAEFAYGRRYLERSGAISLDPHMLPLTPDVKKTEEDFPLFNGLRDAAPDAWGRKLIDRWMLKKHGRVASEAEYLLAPQQGMRIGALRFGPTPKAPGPVLDLGFPPANISFADLAEFQKLVDLIEKDAPIPDDLLPLVAPGSAMGGARPKASIEIDGFPWLAKFDLEHDRIPVARVEAACLDLCKAACLEVCEHEVVEVGGRGVLLVKRFDRLREADGKLRRLHMISGLTLLGAHEMDRGAHGYADLVNQLKRFGRGDDFAEDIFRRMVMNILTGNTDDHYRNHAFLTEGQGYRPSPVYDILPTLQVGQTRHLFLHLGNAGDGREASLAAALMASQAMGLRPATAREIINDLSAMVGESWQRAMRARGVGEIAIEALSGSFGQAGQLV